MLSDTIGACYHNRAWPGWQANLIHHGTAITIFLLLLVVELGHSLGIAAILLEVTTPFVNARWFLDKCGLKSSTLYMANGLAMTLLWLIVRVLGGAGIGVSIAYQWHEVPCSLDPRCPAPGAVCSRRCARVGAAQIAQISPAKQAAFAVAYVLGYGLQLFWFSKIAKGALKVFTGPASKKP